MELQVPWQAVNSSNVRMVAYIEDKEMLCVEFHMSGVYTYFGVKPAMFRALLAAPSMGAFMNYTFKQSNWPYQKGVPGAELFIPEG